MTDSTSFRRTLRQMAEAEDAQDRRRLFDMLASQIEVAFDNQANSTQVVLWDVQEAAYKKIDALHEHQADTNLLLTSVMDALAGLQATVQQVVTPVKELVRGQKKLEAQMRDSQKDRADLRKRLNNQDERLARIEQVLAERPAQREIERQQLLDALKQANGDGNA